MSVSSKNRVELAGIWYQAAETEVGIALETDGNPKSLATQLYQVKDELADPDLDLLSIVLPGTQEVWIVRKDKQ